jgi:hypothetical protein
MGIDTGIWFSEYQLQWLDHLSTKTENYFLLPNVITVGHSDFQFTCDLNAGVINHPEKWDRNFANIPDLSMYSFYLGYLDDEDLEFRPLVEVPHKDWNWSEGGFLLSFNHLIEIPLKKELPCRKVTVKLYNWRVT